MVQLCPRSFRYDLVLLGFFAGTLSCPAQTALVRHAPTINGTVEGSVQQTIAENITLNRNAAVTGDLLVPGTPTVRLNGSPVFGGTIPGTGSAAPRNYQVTLNSGARLGHLRTRTDEVALRPVSRPQRPAGKRRVSLNRAGQSPGDFATIRNLTLDGRAGPVAIPPGTYGNFAARGNSSFILGVAGARVPTVYNFQDLVVDGNGTLLVAGPVIVTVNRGFSANSPMGAVAHPEWLRLRITHGGFALNGNGSFFGYVEAPDGTVTINGNDRLIGGVVCDRLVVNGNGLLRLVAAPAVNMPPTVALTAPAGGASFVFPTALTLAAMAGDADGTVVRVEFFDGTAKLGEGRAVSSTAYQLALPAGLVVGPHILTARVADNLGAVATSSPVSITVTPPPNRPPQVDLALSGGSSTYAAAAPWSLSATAVDADGRVVRVEFYLDDKLIGTLTTPSAPSSDYIFSGQAPTVAGTHVLRARAYDDTGSFADSAPVTITVVARLPYRANFESAEGYRPGPLDGQQGWAVSQGAVEVSRLAAFDGVNAVEMKPGSFGALIRQSFAMPAMPEVTFVELFVHPAAVSSPREGNLFDLGGAHLAFVGDGAVGQLQAWAGDASGGGEWKPAGALVALDANGLARRWVRITARLNYPMLTWDLYVDGQLALFDLGLDYAVTPPMGFTDFSAQGLGSQASHFDFLLAGYDNPLFVDEDRDGMDDAWEVANGLDPRSDDRNADKDGDGLANIREYQLGTRADRADTDGDGMSDGWEVRHHLDPLKAAKLTDDTDHDGASDLQEYAAGTDPVVADTDGDGLPDGWELEHGLSPLTGDALADADGDGWSNLEEYRRGSDPHDFFNGTPPQAEPLHSGGAGPDDELSLLVRKPDGTPWPNAPAVFQITSGTRRISARKNGPDYGTTVSVQADANGIARVYLEPYEP